MSAQSKDVGLTVTAASGFIEALCPSDRAARRAAFSKVANGAQDGLLAEEHRIKAVAAWASG
jgi:hypothetical protein